MSRTSYSPTTATRLTTDGGFVVSSTLVLEPQTTPFVQPSSCSSPPIYCGMDPLSSSGSCIHVDHITATRRDWLQSDCYPPGYTDIFLVDEAPYDMTTAAFPGDACISDWTTACSGTIVGDDDDDTAAEYAQTFCCPPGGYACDLGWTRRSCVSLVSTATLVWVPETTAPFDFVTSQFPAQQQPISVWRAAFPLSSAAAAATATSSGTTTTTAADANAGQGHQRSYVSLSGIAGVVIGSIGVFALMVGLGIWLRRRRAGASPQKYEPAAAEAAAPGFEQQQPGYYYYKAELPTHGTEVSELPGDDHYRPAEVDGRDHGCGPVEVDGQNYRCRRPDSELP